MIRRISGFLFDTFRLRAFIKSVRTKQQGVPMTGHIAEYPLTTLSFKLKGFADDVTVLAIASDREFAVLVPMSGLPPFKPTRKYKEQDDALFDQIVDISEEIAEAYLEMCDEHDTPLKLPTTSAATGEYTAEFLSIDGKLEVLHNDSTVEEDLPLAGEYFYIARVGVPFAEFFPSMKSESNTPYLH